MNRKVKEFKGAYQKDGKSENLIATLNNELSGVHEELLDSNVENQVGIHVVGAPRSGTTLVNQYLISALDIAYPSNLFAAFFKTPLFGVEFTKRFLSDLSVSSFSSKFGRTKGPSEPHEFGYFWNMHLKYDDFQGRPKSHEEKIDWKKLNLIMNNVAAAFEKPVVYKSFLLGFHAERMAIENPKTLFIHVVRGTVENALSLLKFREEVYDSIYEWVSIKPREFESIGDKSAYEQVVQQVMMLNNDYSCELENVSSNMVIRIKYEDFCQSPDALIKEVETRLKQIGEHVGRRDKQLPSHFTVQRSQRSDRQEIEAAFRKLKLDD